MQRDGAARYAEFVAQVKGVKLWEEALKRQIYLGDEAIVQAYRDGGHTQTAIAVAAGLSASRVSELIALSEAAGKTSVR